MRKKRKQSESAQKIAELRAAQIRDDNKRGEDETQEYKKTVKNVNNFFNELIGRYNKLLEINVQQMDSNGQNDGKTINDLRTDTAKKLNFMDENNFITTKGSSNIYLGNEFFGHYLFKKILNLRNKTGGEPKETPDSSDPFDSLFTIIERYNFFLLLFRSFDYHSNLTSGIFSQMFGKNGFSLLQKQVRELFIELSQLKDNINLVGDNGGNSYKKEIDFTHTFYIKLMIINLLKYFVDNNNNQKKSLRLKRITLFFISIFSLIKHTTSGLNTFLKVKIQEHHILFIVCIIIVSY